MRHEIEYQDETKQYPDVFEPYHLTVMDNWGISKTKFYDKRDNSPLQLSNFHSSASIFQQNGRMEFIFHKSHC